MRLASPVLLIFRITSHSSPIRTLPPWYPSRYGPADAFRVGSHSFMFKAVGNLIGEFIAPRR
jgi:hypothetical protein